MCKTVGRGGGKERRGGAGWRRRGEGASERTSGCVMDTQLLYVPAAKNNRIHRAAVAPIFPIPPLLPPNPPPLPAVGKSSGT